MPGIVSGLLKKIFTADYPYCAYCGAEYGVDLPMLCCPACADKLTGAGEFTAMGYSCAACYVFEGPAQRLVHRYKYKDARYLGEKIAQIMLGSCGAFISGAEAVVHVPLHPHKRRQRGYDQAERIAGALARRTDLPHIGALERIRDTATQTRLSREERMENVKGVFRTTADVTGLHLLLIDDVLTTGSTAAECARALTKAGAKSVRILVFARAAD